MKTFLVYSKKPKHFISSVQDIHNLQFVKYGINFWYMVDILNILVALKRKFYAIAAIILLVYLFPSNMQTIIIISLAFTVYIFEGFFLKNRNYQLIGTIQSKNLSEAKRKFIEEKILPNNRVFFTPLQK